MAAGPALRPVRRRLRFAGPRTVMALILREMSATYGRSPGGYVWMILEPVLAITFLVVVFSLGFRSPPLGHNFPIFYATGMLPFTTFLYISNRVSGALSYSRNLLNYPRVTYIDAILGRAILGTLTQLLVGAIILGVILAVWETRTVLILEKVVLAYAMSLALALGTGLLNCFLFTMFPLYATAWAIVTRPLFLLSGVILLYESLPRVVQDVLWWNPLMHVTGEMRSAFYLGYEAVYVTPLYVFGVAAACAVAGLVLLHRYHRDILEL